MPALPYILLFGLGFALMMFVALVMCCIFAPMEEELWPDLYEKKPSDGPGLALDSGEFIPADELNAQQPPRRAGLRIVRD
jgi:hypothetical protein